MSSHDHFEQKLATLLWQLLHSHVVEDQQVGFQVPVQDSIVSVERFVVQEVTYAIEDAAIINGEAITNQLMPDALYQVTLADARWSDEDRIAMFTNEVTGRHVEDLLSFDRRVELEVEVVQLFLVTERCRLGPPGDFAIVADNQLIGQDQLQEFRMIEF